MKLISLLLFLLCLPVGALDITTDYERHYEDGDLHPEQIETLKNTEIALIPGIMSETFIDSDERSRIDLSIFTKDYFGTHLRYLKEIGIPVRRLLGSSASVEDTRKEVDTFLRTSQRPVIFITHSLGGMALLDHLLMNEDQWSRVQGIIFLQSPFTGAPVATVVKKFPALEKLFPFFHTSPETVKYLSNENRKDFVTLNGPQLSSLATKVHLITVGAVVNGYKSLFTNSASLIRSGCLETVYGKCVGPRLYHGPYDVSDGMVPFEGSKLPDVDYVKLRGVDHGETVVHTPFKNINQRRLTAALLKLLL